MASKPQIVKEYAEINEASAKFNSEEIEELKEFALDNTHDKRGKYRPVLALHNGRLKAQNYVGIIQTRKGKALEILPKVDFGDGDDIGHKKTKRVFLRMLRTWRGVTEAQFHEGNIDSLQRFNMLEVFVSLFLKNLVRLTQRGLAKHYQLVEENLPCLKGRILFPIDIRVNIANRARFYVQYDDFNADRPANRLIHKTIHKLMPMARHAENQQLLHQMRIYFSEIPVSENPAADWHKHKIDRTMQHYQAVMQWVGLFLFGEGLTTFSGKHINHCLLFPMEQIFEDFVAYSFRKHQECYKVTAQGPRKNLATCQDGQDRQPVFHMFPDIMLKNGKTKLILDTKWKRINENGEGPKHGISQADLYQLYAYGKKYECRTVALIYPQTRHFKDEICYHFDENLRLLCLPFDVAKPKDSVENIIECLKKRSGQ